MKGKERKMQRERNETKYVERERHWKTKLLKILMEETDSAQSSYHEWWNLLFSLMHLNQSGERALLLVESSCRFGCRTSELTPRLVLGPPSRWQPCCSSVRDSDDETPAELDTSAPHPPHPTTSSILAAFFTPQLLRRRDRTSIRHCWRPHRLTVNINTRLVNIAQAVRTVELFFVEKSVSSLTWMMSSGSGRIKIQYPTFY